MPMAGRIRMYTSGCPNIQNRCCHRIGSPPPDGRKKCVPKKRSNISKTRATVITGNAVMTRNWVTSVIHVNGGRRSIRMPGARMFRIVTTKLKPAASDAIPRICKPSSQKSTLGPGEYCRDVRLAYPNQPRADDERLGSADQEKAERGPEIEQADPLVIGGRQPALHLRLWR